jgi:hypothetical protein
MISAWRVRLEIVRDDGGAIGDQQVRDLTDVLTANGMSPVLERGDEARVRVQVTVQANGDHAGRMVAEGVVRERAYEVWAAHGLPPFTISFIESVPAE